MELSLALIVILSVVAAPASWRLADQQNRNGLRWALGSLLFAGLPLIWLVIEDLFGQPKRASTAKLAGTPTQTCCENQSWTAVADFGHAGGFDLDLGRCENCGAYLMAVFYVESTSYVVLSDEEAARFLALQGKPGFKAALKAWVN